MEFFNAPHPAVEAKRKLIDFLGELRGADALARLISGFNEVRDKAEKSISDEDKIHILRFSASERYGLALLRPHCQMTQSEAFTILMIAIRIIEVSEKKLQKLPYDMTPIPTQQTMSGEPALSVYPGLDFMQHTLKDVTPKQVLKKSAFKWRLEVLWVSNCLLQETMEKNRDMALRDSRIRTVPYGHFVLRCIEFSAERNSMITTFYLLDKKTKRFMKFCTNMEVCCYNMQLLKDFCNKMTKAEKRSHFMRVFRPTFDRMGVFSDKISELRLIQYKAEVIYTHTSESIVHALKMIEKKLLSETTDKVNDDKSQ